MIHSNSTLINQLLLLTLLFGFFITNTNAQIITPNNKITICPSQADAIDIPSFTDPECFESTINAIDPQKKELWIQIQLEIDKSTINQTKPMAIFIHGKASSMVFLNGNLIGNNGKPGSTKQKEIIGLMDAVFFLDDKYLKSGKNDLVIKMSTQFGFIHLVHPINSIRFDIFHNPSHAVLTYYWSSLLPFGAFILSALFLGILSNNKTNKNSLLYLVLMSLFAASQLLTEVSRGFWQYPYYFHDVRLFLILLFSLGFGMSLFIHIAFKFITRRRFKIIVSVLLLSLVGILFAKGFDFKSTLGILVPSLSAMVVCVMAWLKKKPHALLMAIVLLVFSLLFMVNISAFLDRYFYFVVAILMLILISQQALEFVGEKKKRLLEKTRADQLQLIIDQKSEDNNKSFITINAAGKLHKIAINTIAYCKGAGDYVELFLLDNSSLLHSTSLKEIEKHLPHTFIKVHRSYIVNTAQILSLERTSTGTGQLVLHNAMNVPVSRRIMPFVRQKLS